MTQKKSSIIENFLMTFFSHRPFQAFKFSVSKQGDKYPWPTSIGGGQKPLISENLHCSLFTPASSKQVVQTPLPTSMGGHGRIGPSGSATAYSCLLPANGL